jgi:hypothetical protein
MFERPIPHAGFPGVAPDVDLSTSPPRVVMPFQLSHYFQADDPLLEVADRLKACIEAEYKEPHHLESALQDAVEATIRAWMRANNVTGHVRERAYELTMLVGQRMGGGS